MTAKYITPLPPKRLHSFMRIHEVAELGPFAVFHCDHMHEVGFDVAACGLGGEIQHTGDNHFVAVAEELLRVEHVDVHGCQNRLKETTGLIQSEGTYMSRKGIEQHLRLWFDVSSAAITKALRAMASAPLNLLTQEESAHSGREKIVTLSPAGEAHVENMIGRGDAFIRRIIETMTPEEIHQGLHFFSHISDIVDELK